MNTPLSPENLFLTCSCFFHCIPCVLLGLDVRVPFVVWVYVFACFFSPYSLLFLISPTLARLLPPSNRRESKYVLYQVFAHFLCFEFLNVLLCVVSQLSTGADAAAEALQRIKVCNYLFFSKKNSPNTPFFFFFCCVFLIVLFMVLYFFHFSDALSF